MTELKQVNGVRQVAGVWREFGSLINTTLIIFGALAMIWKGGGYAEKIQTDIRANAAEISRVERDQTARWTSHDELHKNRLADVKANDARYDERLKSVESDVRKLAASNDNLSYRIATNEQATLNASQAIKEFQGTLVQLGGDMRVVKEILQRIEAGQKRVP
ncbi:hypothetical protein HGG72_19085 [Ochrobactrum pecoris]|uniref:Septation ring formation regulator EzrA n=1 Tax=Brucella pecoris TaxID=867683 RepID=A0A5C5CVV6_9HYPH|nr:hypothetical protein [Brucella pecoris]MBB4092379.1 septation ring formation regulator EzrA [Brucella pecoris]NKW81945.1 hypothetical protein [Brucella pecoris]TNV15201.1 hypothetical protein FIB18_00100 [Brucella pecoris]